MKKIFIVLLFISAKGTAQNLTPLQFNDKLSAYTDSLFNLGQQWGVAFNTAYSTGDYSILKPHSAGMKKFLEQSIIELENTKDIENSKALRASVIDFLKFEKGMVEKGFIPLEKYNAATPKDTVKASLTLLGTLSQGEKAFLDGVNAEQEKYAQANGFTIEAKKE